MKEIKLYIDEEKIKQETGLDFDFDNQISDNFLQWLQYLAWSGLDRGQSENEKRFRDVKAKELHDILSNTYSDFDIDHIK